jgi:hypothetical protein
VSSSDKDFFGLYKFMIGNIGFDPRSSTYLEDAACKYVDLTNRTSTYLFANETCITVLGQELDMLQVTHGGYFVCFLINYVVT